MLRLSLGTGSRQSAWHAFSIARRTVLDAPWQAKRAARELAYRAANSVNFCGSLRGRLVAPPGLSVRPGALLAPTLRGPVAAPIPGDAARRRPPPARRKTRG